MRETTIEKHLKRRIEGELGGWCIKLYSPWDTGLPDRLVLVPYGLVFFVETKQPGGQVRATQLRVKHKLQRLGFSFRVLWTREAVDAFVDWLKVATLASGEPHEPTRSAEKI